MRSKNIALEDLAGIQYLGCQGITSSCLKAVTRLLATGEEIKRAYLITCDTDHGFLLETHYEEIIAIKAGFSSGYYGEGPRGLAFALEILRHHKVEIDEYEVEHLIMKKLEKCCLSIQDINGIINQEPIRPQKWHEYIYEQLPNQEELSQSSASKYPLSIPFSLVDARIRDLAIDLNQNADHAIISAFRRLEDLLRTRTEASGEGTKLFSKIFLNEDRLLLWDVPDEGEAKGRANLFIATYMAFRNARVHRECDSSPESSLREFLLVNELFRLEAEALTKDELISKRALQAEEDKLLSKLFDNQQLTN